MEGYCVKCKAKRTIKNPVKVDVNNHPAVRGVCPVCGTKIFRFVKK